jgi:hypothetical protein
MPAFHARWLFNPSNVLEPVIDAIEKLFPKLWVGHFAAAEHHRNLDLITLFDELLGRARLEVDIVLVNLWPNANFAKQDVVLVLLGLTFLLRLFILELAVVKNAANGRHGGWRYFNEIGSALSGNVHGLHGRHDAKLLAVDSDDAHFARADSFIDAKFAADRLISFPKLG